MPVAVLVAFLSLLGAFASSLLGVGGAIITLPLLLYAPPVFGQPPFEVGAATGLATVQVLFSTVLGTLAHRRYGTVNTRLVLWVGPSMAGASLLAAVVSSALPARLLLLVFASVASAAGLVMLIPVRHHADEEHWSAPATGATRPAAPFSRPLACLVGAGAGTLVGLVGAGTFVLAPAFLHLLRVPTRVTIGSTLGVAMFAALAAAFGKATTGQVPLAPAVGVLIGTGPGVLLGAYVSTRLPPRALRWLLAAIIILVALRAWWDLLR